MIIQWIGLRCKAFQDTHLERNGKIQPLGWVIVITVILLPFLPFLANAISNLWRLYAGSH